MIRVPRFGEGSSKKSIEKFNSTSEALQELCQSCLRLIYPNFYIFPTLGRDGAIDGVHEGLWVECKVCPEDKAESLIQKWKDSTEKSLKTQLKKGANLCQKQYKPWFSTKNAINKYILFTNAWLPNEASVRKLKNYISKVFAEIGESVSGLDHLKDVKIEIWHWARIRPLFQENLHLLYQWYWAYWPPGMIPINIKKDAGFKSYLYSSKLPYYSLTDFKKKTGRKLNIRTEDEILDSFNETEKIGKIIVGQAGTGKTRLSVEIGKLAYQKKWIVFNVSSDAPLSSVAKLFENLNDSDKVLLLIDYVELMDNFKGFVEEIDSYNKKFGKKVFYIATCRPSYYKKLISGDYTHELINLSKASDDWISSYREEVIFHILKYSKIENFEEYLPLCKGIPVLSVLILHLYENKKISEMKEILKFDDFGKWLSNHLKLTLLSTEDDSLVAMFFLSLPISTQQLEKMPPEIERMKNKLSADGWIETSNDEKEMKFAIHDVISDGIAISYCNSIRPEIKSFIKKGFKFARKFNCLNSVLIAFERIADDKILHDIQWGSIIFNEIKNNPDDWKNSRLKILLTSLLNEEEKIVLLSDNFEYWNDLFTEKLFHRSLGWLIGWLYKERERNPKNANKLEKSIKPLIYPSLKHAKDNYLICRAFQSFPEEFCESAYNWAEKWKCDINDSYILGAYIRCPYKYAPFEKYLKKWFDKNSSDFSASHVLRALFEAGRTSEVEADWLKRWLSVTRISKKRRKLIDMFIEHGGKFSDLKDFFLEIIKSPEQNDSVKCDYIIHWLDHGDEIDSIEKYILNFSPSKDSADSNFIYRILPTKKFELSNKLLEKCLLWCEQNCDNEESLWNLKKIVQHHFDKTNKEKCIEAFKLCVECINYDDFDQRNFSTINTILYYLLNYTHEDKEMNFKVIDIFSYCLEDNRSFDKNFEIFDLIQHVSFFFGMLRLLKYNFITMKDDQNKVSNFMKWFKRWKPERKRIVESKLNILRRKYPSNLWD